MRILLALLIASLIAGCGFKLRESVTLPYSSLYVALPDYAEFGADLKRAIRATGSTQLAATAAAAQAVLNPAGESREKTILSLNSAGRVREFQLRYRYAYRVQDPQGHDLIDPVTIVLTRDFTFDDAAILAKEQEENLLWRDMQNDLVQQIMRRLASSRPKFVAGS